MKVNHKYFTNLAFNLAETHLGKTNLNPSVGCIVVKNKSVISSGVTSAGGRPHAEYNALNKGGNFNGSDMYVTLEPCTHYGLTPPCTNIIKNKKIKNVFFSYNDPDIRTYKKAKNDFKKANIKFKKILIKNKFYESYFINKTKSLPLIDAKIAISKDFMTINKKSKRITNNRSEIVTHLLRSRYDCILSTSKTINNDNALLNCRIDGLNNYKPDLLIIDRNLKLKNNLKLFKIAKIRKTYVFTVSNNKKKIALLRKKKCKVFKINALKTKSDFVNFLNLIFKLGKRRVLIETGLLFLNEFLRFKFLNNIFLFKSNQKLSKNGYNNANIKYLKKFKLNNQVKVNLKEDKLFKVNI